MTYVQITVALRAMAAVHPISVAMPMPSKRVSGAARHTRRRIALEIIKLHGHTGMAKKDPSTKEANAMKGMPVLKLSLIHI